MKVKSLSRVRLLATPWTAAYQAPPSMGFSRQEYRSGVPLPSPIKYIENGLLFSHKQGEIQPFTITRARCGEGTASALASRWLFSDLCGLPSFPSLREEFGGSPGKLPSQLCLMLEALRSDPDDPSTPLLVRSGQTFLNDISAGW